ncbi:MAG: response regulator [Synechococcales bacterium]|nr:response regulator [Synechococcales bacterium]
MENSVVNRIILVLEPNPDYAQLIERTLRENAIPHSVAAIADGEEAIAYLRRHGPYKDAPRPDLVLLDLNLPGKNGWEILAEMKADPQLRRIPTIVLTLSEAEEDIVRSYALQSNCYVVKSSDLEQLSQTVARIREFWLRIVTLPVQ